MKITEISLENFRCFPRLTVPFHDNLTVIVGINGAGKTSILEAVAIAIGTFLEPFDEITTVNIKKTDAHHKYYPMGGDIDVQPQYPVHISANGTVENQTLTWKRSLQKASGKTTISDAKSMQTVANHAHKRMMEGDTTLFLPLIAYYGTGRLWDYHRNKRGNEKKQNNRSHGYTGCLDGTANIKLMLNWFEKKTVAEVLDSSPSPEFVAVRSAMEQCFTLMTGFREVSIRYNYDTKEIDITYRSELGNLEKKSINQFSDGYKGTISLIADIAYRIAVLNPILGKEVLTATEGIILIDEVDLHLHPAWQQRILGDLQEIFPKIQFIVTTHAPSIINSVKSENLVILDENEIKDQTSQVYGKDVNSVLQEIMGVRERPPLVAELFQDFYVKLGAKDYDGAENLLAELDILRHYHDPEVASCKVKLKLERMRGTKK